MTAVSSRAVEPQDPVAGRRRRSRSSLSLRTRATPVSIIVGTLLGLAAWEVAARILAAVTPQGDRVLPSLVTVATSGVLGLGHYYTGGLGISVAAAGGDGHVLAAVLALVSNGVITIARVVIGLAAALAIGLVLGLLVSAVRPVRLSVSGIAEVIRMLPALAMAPLFTLWFGATSLSSVVFVIFGVTFIVFVATVNAVANLPAHVTDFPRTLGVHGGRLYSHVVLPAILPELRGSLVFGGLVAWTSVLASEINGLESGLGYMLGDALRFSRIDRMFVIAVVFSALALATMKLLGWGVNRLTRWRDGS